jgi:hypothetical protein
MNRGKYEEYWNFNIGAMYATGKRVNRLVALFSLRLRKRMLSAMRSAS